MAPSAPTTQNPALAHNAANVAQQSAQQGLPQNTGDILANVGLNAQQLIELLRNIPSHLYNKGNPEQGKEDAAQTLSNLSQAPFTSQTHLPVQQHPYPGLSQPGSGLPGINDPGPSSHPRGPPNLGQLSNVAVSAPPAQAPRPLPPQAQEVEEGETASGQSPGGKDSTPVVTTSSSSRRGGRSATMGSDEWTRQRKDNHKEVERRRRGNINEGINELGRIVPNGSGEKAKGAILSRAVQYIHHLKENEARNIEKWTLEKLLMDQAMGDLQTQLEEIKRFYEEERNIRQRLENELQVVRSGMHNLQISGGIQGQGMGGKDVESLKRDSVEGGDGDRDGKRQRTE